MPTISDIAREAGVGVDTVSRVLNSNAREELYPALAPDAGALPDAPMVLAVGHSTRSLHDFLSLLGVYGVTYLVDVRTVPRSRCTTSLLERRQQFQ